MLLPALLLAMAPAEAFTYHGVGLAPNPAVPYLATALHHPSVDWDATRSRHVMVFATDQPGHVDCPDGVTGLGLAVSAGGRNWTPGLTPVVLPDPAAGTCAFTEPAVVYDAAADVLHVWYVAESTGNVVDGIGHLEVPFDAIGSPVLPPLDSGVVLAGADHREPSVVHHAGTYVMMLARYPDLDVATGSTPTTLSLDGTALNVNDFMVAWMDEPFLRGSMTCQTTGGAFPLEVYAGGVDSNGTPSIGKAVASPLAPTNWTLSVTPTGTFPSLAAWEGFDVLLRPGSGDGEVITMGRGGSIHVGSTLAPGIVPDPQGKTCP